MLMAPVMRAYHIGTFFLLLSLLGYCSTRRPCTRPRTTQRPWTTSRPDALRNATCNFDDIPCGLTQDTTDDMDFSFGTGSTPSANTGPSGDHTSGHGRYIYIEGSFHPPGSRARMTTYQYLRHSACMFFHYHMYGAGMGTLKVYINNRLQWQLQGNQGNQWLKATIPVQMAGGLKIGFEFKLGDSQSSDLALDDLGYVEHYYINRHVCDLTPSCAKPTSPPTAFPSPSPSFPSPSFPSPSFPPLPPLNVSCGLPDIPPARVIGGVDVRPGSWPWQIALKIYNYFICGGSLVSPRWVVTAAHCIFSSIPPSSYRIVAGDHNRSISEGTEQSINVSKIIVHPNWNRTTIDSDIALIYLSRPAIINYRVKPVCLPRQDEVVPRDATCYITGWGKIRHPGSSHHTLQQARLPIVKRKCCQKKIETSPIIPSRIQFTDNMMCAGKEGSTKSGCHGDSGGPFVCRARDNRWVLQGVVSWGSPRCDTRDTFSMFARVARFRKWIDYHMNSV